MVEDLVTIVVPVYNEENKLSRCLKSVCDQSYKNIEIILVDDGSDDDSAKICDSFAATDKRVKVVHKQNEGLSSARNLGIKLAHGIYIVFVDSNDYIDLNMIEVLYNNLINSQARISVCKCCQIYRNVKVKSKDSEDVWVLNTEESLNTLFKWQWGNYAWNKLYATELFDSIKYPKNTLFEDIYTTYQLYLSSPTICFTNKSLYYYEQNMDSISLKSSKKHLKDEMAAYEKLLDNDKLAHLKSDINACIKAALKKYIGISYNDLKRNNSLRSAIFKYFRKYLMPAKRPSNKSDNLDNFYKKYYILYLKYKLMKSNLTIYGIIKKISIWFNG